MLENHPAIIVFILCFSTAAVVLHSYKNKITLPLNILLGFFMVVGVISYTNFGNFNFVKKDTPEFVNATGSQTKKALFHWHEIYHYYLGAKYYPENGHFGLYESVVLADRESKDPVIKSKYMRDSIRYQYVITTDNGAQRAREKYRPKFTDERWEEFKRDVEYMKSLALSGWLDVGLYDAGFNPPPTWTVIGYTIANIMPLSESWFDYGPTWDQSQFLTLFDLALLIACCVFIYRSFGYIGLCLFVITFCTSYISNYNWIMGSFFRHIWLFGIVMCFCMLKEKKYFWAGFFIGLSTLMRVFPIAFAFAIFIALLLQWRQQKTSLDNIKSFVYGGLTIAAILIPASLIMFGWDQWTEFFRKINLHKDIFFVAHLGYKKIAVFDTWVPNQSFWWEQGMDRFREWNERLNQSWDSVFPYHFPFIVITLGIASWTINKISIEEAGLLLGTLIIFFFQIPANYYYSFLCLVPVILFSQVRKDEWQNTALASVFLLMWGFMYFIPRINRDDIVYTYYFCLILLVYFLFWILLRVVNLKDLAENLNNLKNIGKPD